MQLSDSAEELHKDTVSVSLPSFAFLSTSLLPRTWVGGDIMAIPLSVGGEGEVNTPESEVERSSLGMVTVVT